MNSAKLKPRPQAKSLDELLLQTEDWKKLLAVIEQLQQQRDNAIRQISYRFYADVRNHIADDDAELAAILEGGEK